MMRGPGIRTLLIWSSTIVCACGWGISALGLVLPSERAFSLLGAMAGHDIAPIPMLDYWLRMTAAAFTFLGVLFVFTLTDISRYRPIGLAMGFFQVLCGLVLVGWGMRLRLPIEQFGWDVAFCLSTGLVLIGSLIGLREEHRSDAGTGSASR